MIASPPAHQQEPEIIALIKSLTQAGLHKAILLYGTLDGKPRVSFLCEATDGLEEHGRGFSVRFECPSPPTTPPEFDKINWRFVPGHVPHIEANGSTRYFGKVIEEINALYLASHFQKTSDELSMEAEKFGDAASASAESVRTANLYIIPGGFPFAIPDFRKEGAPPYSKEESDLLDEAMRLKIAMFRAKEEPYSEFIWVSPGKASEDDFSSWIARAQKVWERAA